MERLALPQPKYVRDVSVNSDTLLDYLMVLNNSFFKGETHFARTLDLALLEPFLRELHQTEQLGYVHTEKERQEAGFIDPSSIKNPLIRELEIQRQRVWTKILDDRQPVERYRSVYLDNNNDDDIIKVSGINHGDYTAGTVDTIELFEQGHTPLFEIHTHPIDSLFSDADYRRLIMDGTVPGGMRLLKGAILVCPNIQVLALATPGTMFSRPEQVDLFGDRHNLEQSDIGIRIGQIQRELGASINDPHFKLMDQAHEIGRITAEEAGYYERGLYSDREFETVKQRLIQEYITYSDSIWEDAERRLQEATTPLIAERRRLYILNEMTIAREVNAKLYIATDFRHFKEFTA